MSPDLIYHQILTWSIWFCALLLFPEQSRSIDITRTAVVSLVSSAPCAKYCGCSDLLQCQGVDVGITMERFMRFPPSRTSPPFLYFPLPLPLFPRRVSQGGISIPPTRHAELYYAQVFLSEFLKGFSSTPEAFARLYRTRVITITKEVNAMYSGLP